ncbi:hypothetical protein HZS_2256 [Henneguya salminicola]|nr:hypothetical protein HZS_2256 [Henneguya salminicola]
MIQKKWMLFFISLYLSMIEMILDSSFENIEFKVSAFVFGYSSFRNTGVNQKCCGDEKKKICDPCRYVVFLNQIMNGGLIMEFRVGSFTRQSQQLNQRLHFKILGSSAKMDPTFKYASLT